MKVHANAALGPAGRLALVKAILVRNYLDRKDALEAAGLPEWLSGRKLI